MVQPTNNCADAGAYHHQLWHLHLLLLNNLPPVRQRREFPKTTLGTPFFWGKSTFHVFCENPRPDLSSWVGNLRCWQNSAGF